MEPQVYWFCWVPWSSQMHSGRRILQRIVFWDFLSKQYNKLVVLFFWGNQVSYFFAISLLFQWDDRVTWVIASLVIVGQGGNLSVHQQSFLGWSLILIHNMFFAKDDLIFFVHFFVNSLKKTPALGSSSRVRSFGYWWQPMSRRSSGTVSCRKPKETPREETKEVQRCNDWTRYTPIFCEKPGFGQFLYPNSTDPPNVSLNVTFMKNCDATISQVFLMVGLGLIRISQEKSWRSEKLPVGGWRPCRPRFISNFEW